MQLGFDLNSFYVTQYKSRKYWKLVIKYIVNHKTNYNSFNFVL